VHQLPLSRPLSLPTHQRPDGQNEEQSMSSILTEQQKSYFKPAINFFGYLLAICVMIALVCKFILSGYPPVVAWLEPFNELVIVLGAVALGIVVYSNNKLVK
jgi:hypothetical protein